MYKLHSPTCFDVLIVLDIFNHHKKIAKFCIQVSIFLEMFPAKCICFEKSYIFTLANYNIYLNQSGYAWLIG